MVSLYTHASASTCETSSEAFRALHRANDEFRAERCAYQSNSEYKICRKLLIEATFDYIGSGKI